MSLSPSYYDSDADATAVDDDDDDDDDDMDDGENRYGTPSLPYVAASLNSSARMFTLIFITAVLLLSRDIRRGLCDVSMSQIMKV